MGDQFWSLRMMFSWVTWVFTLVLMGAEFAFHRSRTMKLSLGVSVGFTRQSLLKTVHNPLLGDGEALAFVGCRLPAVAGADPDLVHCWHA